MGLCLCPWDQPGLGELLKSRWRAEGVQWESGAGLGNPGRFSNASGWSLQEELVALVGLLVEAGICHGRDWGLGAEGRESSKGGKEMARKEGGKKDYKD